jgi:D-alanine--poly(phosphoribitol) ligase subunit 2
MLQKLTDYLEESLMFEFSDKITQESDLFKAGIIDSYGYIKLIRYLQTEFGVTFSEEEILDNIFVSLQSLAECLERKLAA